jgi:hypothetical protein
MTLKHRLLLLFVIGSAATSHSQTATQQPAGPTVTAIIRERTNATQWFAASPTDEVYGHQDSMLRLSLAQRIRRFDYMAEIGQSAELALPSDAVSGVSAQGQLGLGGTYFAANGNNYPAAASLRQGFLRYHFQKDASAVRLGRFEFFEGQELAPKDATQRWLQT